MPILSKTIKQLIDAAELGQSTAGFLVRDTGAALALDAAANGGAGRYISNLNGNPAVEFTSTETGVDRVNAVNAATTGAVTATINATAAELANLTGWGSGSHNQYTIHVDGPISLADLHALDAKTDGMIYADVTGTASDLAVTLGGLTNNNITVHDVHITDLGTVAELNVIWAHRGSGTIYINGIRDDVSNLVNADGTAGAQDAATWYTAQASFDVQGLPSIAQIKKIDALNGTGAVTYSSIADTYANIVADAGVDDVGAGKDIVVIGGSAPDGKPTIADLDAVALLQDAASNPYATTSSVTAPVITDTASALAVDAQANNGHGQFIATATAVHVVDGNSGVVANDIATIGQLNDIAFALTGTASTPSSWQSVRGDANDLAVDASWNGGVGRFVTGSHAVFVDSNATVTNLNVINAHTTGAVTATISGSAAVLAGLAAGPANDYTISVTGTISASALAALDLKTDSPITATVVSASTTAEASAIATALQHLGSNNVITVTVNTVSIDALKTLDGLAGVATPNVTSIKDSVDNLFADATGTYQAGVQSLVQGYAVPVEVTGAPSVAQLLALKTDSAASPVYNQVADTAANLITDHASPDHFSDGVDVRVTFDGNAQSPSLQNLADVDVFAGVVTADKIVDTDQNILADINAITGLGTYINGAVDVVFTTDANLDTLVAVRRATTGALDYSTITGSAVALAADIGVHGNHFVNSDKTVNVDIASLGSPATAQDVANLNTISGATTGHVYATLTGSGAVLSGLTGGSNAYYDLTVNDAHPTVDQLNTLSGKTQGDITISGTITDSTAANLARLTGTTNMFSVTVSDAGTIDQLTKISAHTASPTYTDVADTLAHLTADKTGAGLITGKTVKITDTGADAVTVAQIKALNTGIHNPAANQLSAAAVKDNATNLTGADGHYATGADITVTLNNGHGPSVTQLATIASSLSPSHLTSTTVEDAASAIIADNVYSTVATSVVVTGTPTLGELNDVALHTPATLSYAAVSGTGNLLASNTEVTGRFNFVKGSVNVTVDNNSATVLNLNKIDAATTGVITATLSGTAAELADLRAAGFNGGAANLYTITVTGSISAEAVAALDAKTSGAITVATAVTGTAAAIRTAFASLGSNNSINVTTAADASVDDLVFIDGKVGVNTLTITSIKDTVANLFDANGVKSSVTTLIGANNVPVTVLGAATLQQLAALDTANGSSAVTYTAISDDASNFANAAGVATANATTYVTSGKDVDVKTAATIAQLTTLDTLNVAGQLTYGGIVDALSAVVSGGVASAYVTGNHAVDVSQTATAAITDLNAIAARTTGVVTGTAAVTGALADLAADADLNAGVGRFLAGNHAVTITSITGVTAGDVVNINKVDAATSGVITTSLTGAAAVLGGLTSGSNAYTLTVTDPAPTVSSLNALVNKTSGNIGTIYTVTGSASDLAGLTGSHNTFNVTADADAKVTDLATIKLHTSGTVTYTSVKDTAAALAADANGVGDWVKAGHAVTVIDGASIQNLVDIKAASASGAVAPTYTTVKDSSANLAAVIDATTKLSAWIKPTTTVVVNGGGTGTTADIGEIALIDAATDVAVSYGAVSGSIAALYNDAILNGSTGRYITGHDVTVNGNPASVVAADITKLNAVSAATTGFVTANMSGAAAAFANLSSEVNHYAITVTGTIGASELAALDAKTDGVITATVTTAAASAIASQLTNLGSNNLITVTVSGGDAIADLASIKLHSNVTLNYSTISDTVENLFNASTATLKAGNSALLSGHTVTVTGSTAPSLAQLATLKTTGGAGHSPVYTAIADDADSFLVSARALSGNAATFVTAGTNVTVNQGASVEKLGLIDTANTTGALNYTKVKDTVANVLTDINGNAQGTYVKTDVAVDVASTPLADIMDLNTIRGVVGARATMTWGNVEGDLSDLAADALLQTGGVYNGFVSGVRGVTINAPSIPVPVIGLDVAKINAIDTANGGVIHASLTGSAADLLGLSAGLNDYVLMVNDGTSVSVANMNALAARTVGNIDTVTNVSGSSSDLARLTGTHNVFDVDVAPDAAVNDLAVIDAHSATVNYSTIKDSASNLATGGTLTQNGGVFVTGSHDVEVIGGSVAQLNAVASHTTGVVTASIAGNASTLVGLAHTGGELDHNDYTVTVTGEVSLADLALIDHATSQSLASVANSYGRVTGTSADIIANAGGYVNGSHDVLVDDPATVDLDVLSVSDAVTIAALTTGVVTAQLSDSAVNLLAVDQNGDFLLVDNGADNDNMYAIEVTDPSIGVTAANNIAALTAGVVTATVSGNAVDVAGLEAGNYFNVTVTGGDISIPDLVALDLKTDGVITSSVSGSVTDLAGLASVANTNITNVTVTGTVSIQDLADIDAHNGTGVLNHDGMIFDTAAHLAADAALNGGEGKYLSKDNVTIDGDVTLTQLFAIDAANGAGTLTYGAVRDDLISLDLEALRATANDRYVKGHEVFVDGAVSAQAADIVRLNHVLGATDQVVHATLSGSATVLAGITVEANNDLTLNAGAVAASAYATLNTIASATTGVVTASVSGSAADLVHLFDTQTNYNHYSINVNVGTATVSQLGLIDLATSDQLQSVGAYAVSDNIGNLLADNNFYVNGTHATEVQGEASVANLATIDSFTNGTFTWNTVRDQISALYADNTYVSGAHPVIVDGAVASANVAKLASVASRTTGVVTAAVSGSYAVLSSLTDTVANFNNYSITVEGPATVAQLGSIDNLTSQSLAASGIYAVSDSIGALLTDNGAYVSGSHAADVVGSAMVADLKKIDDFTTGAFTYATVADDLTSLFGDTTYATGSHAVSVTGAVAASDWSKLNTVAGRTTGVVTASVSGSAADLVHLFDTQTNYNHYSINVNVGTATISQLGVIDLATSDQLQSVGAYAVSDNIGNLLADNNFYVNGTHATEVQGEASVANLATIDSFTNGTFTWNTVRDQISALYADSTYVSGAHPVIVDGAVASANVAKLASVANRTSGVVTAAVSGSYAVLSSLTDTVANFNNYTFTVEGPATVAQLGSIDNLTSQSLAASGIYAVSDSIGALLTDNGAYVSGSHAADVVGSAMVADLKKIDDFTTGAFTYATVADDLTSLFGDTTYATGSHAVSVTGAVAASDWSKLNTVAGRTTGVVTASVSGVASDLARLVDAGNTDAYTVTVTDAASISNLTSIDLVTSGAINYTAVKDSHVNIVNDHGFYVRSSDTVTDTDTASTISGWSVADLRGLGALNIDVLDASDNQPINVTLAQYNGFKASGVSLALGDSFKFENVSDFNYDGKSDVMLQSKADGSIFFWNISGKTIASGGLFGGAPGTDWVAKGTGDFDGNHYGDVVFQRVSDGAVYVWGNSANGLSGHGFAGPTSGMADWKVIGTGDFNGDQKSDLLFQNTKTGMLFGWNMDGNVIKAGAALSTELGASLVAKAVGDFNGDGFSDVVLQRITDGAVYVMDLDGSRPIGTGVLDSGWVGVAPGVDWQLKGAGDFNNDGKSDVLFQNANDGSLMIWELNGAGTYGVHDTVRSGGAVATPGKDWVVKDVGDYNADGKSDVMFQQTSTGAVYTWELDGTNVIDHGYVTSFASTGWQVI